MALPKPLSVQDSGMPQMKRRSALRTASGTVQEQFLEHVRAVAKDPTLVLPTSVGTEARPVAALRKRLESGSLGFAARFDKGLLGALRIAQELADQETAPVLLDARVDGNRRFFLARGHVVRLVHLGVQNWDDPLALLLAYGPLAAKHDLWFFAGRDLWSTGTIPAPSQAWWDDLAERAGLSLAATADGDRSCPHADRPRLEFRFPGGPALLVCGPCGKRTGNLNGHLTTRVLRGDAPSRPADLQVAMPDGRRLAILDSRAELYRFGRLDEVGLLDATTQGSVSDALFDLAGHGYASQDAFLDALGLADWEREPVRILTAGGHKGPSRQVADVLAAHRDRLPDAVASLLGESDASFLAQHAGTEARTLLRLARDEAQRRRRLGDLPTLTGLGSVGAWFDGLVRDQRTMERTQFLQRLRKEAAHAQHPAHFFAALVALGLAHEGERYLAHDAKEAGRTLAPLARRVLDATGADYAAALGDYLRESGTGETVSLLA